MRQLLISGLWAILLSAAAVAGDANFSPKVALNGCPGNRIPCTEWCDRCSKVLENVGSCYRICSWPGFTAGLTACVLPPGTPGGQPCYRWLEEFRL
jgi:hypothetical protein